MKTASWLFWTVCRIAFCAIAPRHITHDFDGAVIMALLVTVLASDAIESAKDLL